MSQDIYTETPAEPSSVEVDATSTLIIAANAARGNLVLMGLITNTEPVYLGYGTDAVQDKGKFIMAQGVSEIDIANLGTMAIYGICASGGQTITIQEADR